MGGPSGLHTGPGVEVGTPGKVGTGRGAASWGGVWPEKTEAVRRTSGPRRRACPVGEEARRS